MHQQMENQLSLCSVIAQNKVRSVSQDGAQVQVMTLCTSKEYFHILPSQVCEAWNS